MNHQIQVVAQGVPTLPCLLPFIMGCLIRNTRAAPVAQTNTGEPAILGRDTLRLPLVARLLINTENDGPLAVVPTQVEARSDADTNPTVPDLDNIAAQTVPTLTVEERPGSGQALPTDVAGSQEDVNPSNTVAESIPNFPVDGTTARSLPTDIPEDEIEAISIDGTSARSIPTDIPSPEDDEVSKTDGTTARSLPTDTPEDIVEAISIDGTSARSIPTDIPSPEDDEVSKTDGTTARSLPTDTPEDIAEAISIDGTSARAVPTDIPSPEDDEVSKTDGTTARSVPTDAAIAVAKRSADQSDSDDTVASNDAELHARDPGMTLSSVYLLLG